jgi:hypothetical protein
MMSGIAAVSQLLQRGATTSRLRQRSSLHLLSRRLRLTAIPVLCRTASSTSRVDSKPSHPGTEAVPFLVIPAAALERFKHWQRGVQPLSIGSRIVSMQALYLPFWAFAGDFTCRAGQETQRLPGETPALLVYSGSCLPRPMAEVIKCPTRAAEPFRSSLLDSDMQVRSCWQLWS